MIGWQVRDAEILWPRSLATPTIDEFKARIRDQKVQDIWRRGKFIVFSLTNDYLLIHLRMSGDLLIEDQSDPAAVHHRLILNFINGKRLAFNDTRKFGRVWLVRKPEDVVGDLGPEPLDRSLSDENFYRCLYTTRRKLKPLLLDQTFLAGLGNIYTDEALHLAKLHPLTPAQEVSQEQARTLLKAIRLTLEEGIRRNGASIDWVYRGGDFQNYFRVYNRTNEPCPECGAAIQYLRVGQRGTHICPVCQKLPSA